MAGLPWAERLVQHSPARVTFADQRRIESDSFLNAAQHRFIEPALGLQHRAISRRIHAGIKGTASPRHIRRNTDKKVYCSTWRHDECSNRSP